MDQNFEKDFKDVLQDPTMGEEIGADEAAVRAAGLTHPSEVALESILAEDWDSVPDLPEAEAFVEELTTQAPPPEAEAAEVSAEETEAAVEETEATAEAVPEAAEVDMAAEMAYEADTSATERGSHESEPAAEEISLQDAPTQVIPDITQRLTPVVPEPAEETELTDEPQQEEPQGEYVVTHVRKGRPKMKKGYGLLGIPHLISTAIWLLLTVVIGISLGRVLWVCCADVMSFGKPPVTAYITVTEEDDIESVSKKLADANLIRYPGLFQQFAEITEKSDRIQVGTYELGSHLDYNAMINNMVYTSVSREEIEITFPEGYNTAQTFRLLEKQGVCSVADLEEWAMNGELDEYWFLEGLERNDKYWLEGYLAPDTYRFYTNDEPRNVLQKFLDAFDARFTDIMRDDLANMQERYAKMLANGGFSSEYIASNPLTLHQVLTVASIVERETADDAESYDIASVFYNRVTDPDIGSLGSDATVYYALGDYFREHGELTAEDLDSDSPYNTRKARGIPPGPICNPGAYALYAALDPNDTDYHYFIYDVANNKHLFSVTYNEHLQKAEELGE